MDATKEGLLLKILFSDQVRTYVVGVGSGLGTWAALKPGIILCMVSWLGSPSLPGVWVLRYCGFVLAGDMSDQITKVAKDPEVQPGHNLGPGMRVVWGGAGVKIDPHYALEPRVLLFPFPKYWNCRHFLLSLL